MGRSRDEVMTAFFNEDSYHVMKQQYCTKTKLCIKSDVLVWEFIKYTSYAIKKVSEIKYQGTVVDCKLKLNKGLCN